MEPRQIIELSDDDDESHLNLNTTRKPIKLTTNEPEVIELYVLSLFWIFVNENIFTTRIVWFTNTLYYIDLVIHVTKIPLF